MQASTPKTHSNIAFILKVALPAIVGVFVLFMLASNTIHWATDQIDRQAQKKQTDLASTILQQARAGIAHDQESATVWADAVEALTSSLDMEWVDSNLGSWMHTYFGHDAIYVLDKSDKQLFAFADNDVRPVARYDGVRPVAEPLAKALRARLAAGDQTGISDKVLTIGITEIAEIDGRPSIISLKPVVTDSDESTQAPGQEPIHIAIRYLDGNFLDQFSSQLGFRNVAVNKSAPSDPSLVSLALRSNDGSVTGYLVWTPDSPGTDFVTSIQPLMVGASALLIVMVGGLLVVLYRRSVANAANQARIAFLALHDALTGLPNRRGLDGDLDAALAAKPQADDRLAIIYLDLDRFKQVNDTLGHAAGDIVIKEAGNRILGNLKGEGRLYRIGGDEFFIVVREKAVGSIETLCDQIIADICQPVRIGENTVYIGVSIGVAFAPDHGLDRIGLARKADVALYHAKENGRCQFSIFGVHMDMAVSERLDMERELREAMNHKSEFVLHYQPKFKAGTRELMGVEALVRWNHPRRGELAPATFIPMAEETGMINDLGRYILEEACKAAAKWPSGIIAVNVSPAQLRDPSFSFAVVSALEMSKLPAERLELEITETSWLNDHAVASLNIATIRRLGVSIALDDFGTGFSSFGRLHETRIDRLKIDQRFVRGLGKSRGDEAIVRAIIDMARANGMTTTAEGVETEEQGDFLHAAGCDELQGFLMSRPVPEDEIAALFVTRPDNNPSISRIYPRTVKR